MTLAARTTAEIEAAAQAIRARSDGADAVRLDVTDIAAVRALRFGREPSTSSSTMPE